MATSRAHNSVPAGPATETAESQARLRSELRLM